MSRLIQMRIPVYHLPNAQVDSFGYCVSDTDTDSGEEVESTLETTLSMIRSTKLERIRTRTGQKTYFLQAGMTGM